MTNAVILAGLAYGGTNGGLVMPSGTTAQRPAVPVDGMMRRNTTNNNMEYYKKNLEI